jgi:predicted ester cyclase
MLETTKHQRPHTRECATFAAMDADDLKAKYRRWLLEVWGAGRYEVDDELLHVDLVDHNRYDGQPDGRAGDVWAAQMVRRAFPDLRFVPDLVVSDGEFVAGRWTMTGTNTGTIDLFGLPPTGRPVTMTGQEVFRAEGKQFVEVWHQEDLPGMLAQLGLQPPPVLMRLAARHSAWRYRRAQR